jgi:hypothetical protein
VVSNVDLAAIVVSIAGAVPKERSLHLPSGHSSAFKVEEIEPAARHANGGSRTRGKLVDS